MPEFDAIRNKVSFDTHNPPARFLVLKDKATPKEGQVLLAWAATGEECARHEHGAIATLPLPPSMDEGIKERAKAGLTNVVDQDLRSTNILIAALYQRQITYGEFNRRRAEITAKIFGGARGVGCNLGRTG